MITARAESLVRSLQNRRKLMQEYLQLKVGEEDWHGVADAAMDLRDIDSEILGYTTITKFISENGNYP